MLNSGYRVEDNSDIETSVISAAKKHYTDGNYDLAIKLYLGLLKTSASSKLYLDVGLCYYKKNDFDSAIEHLLRAVTLDDSNSVAYSYLGNCYFRKLDANKSIECWTKARSISPRDESVCLNLAIAYFAKNMFFESTFYYDKYLKYAQNKESKQYKAIQKNINTAFSDANDLYIQAQKSEHRNNSVSAERNYLFALKKYPIISEYNTKLADLYSRMKEYKTAIKYYNYSLFNTNNKITILNIAQCYEAINDYKNAYCFYKRYMKYIFNSPEAYLEFVKKTNSLKKQIDMSSTNDVLEKAKQHYENNEYYNAYIEYENYTILKPEEKENYLETINKLMLFINPEKIITKSYLKRASELLNQGERQGANRYFTEVMHLSNPKSDEYKIAKSRIANV